METLTITIEISHETAMILEEKALKDGKDSAEYLESLIKKDIETDSIVDEVFAAVRKKFSDEA